MVHIVWACILACWVTLAAAGYNSLIFDFLAKPPANEVVALRTQRDISMKVPIDQVQTMGVSLNQLIFAQQGYTDAGITSVGTSLNLGAHTLMVDLFWNQFIHRWQLCPAPIPGNLTSQLDSTVSVLWNNRTYKCQMNITIESLVSAINSYCKQTNTNMDVSMVQVLVNLKEITTPSVFNRTGNANTNTNRTSPATAQQSEAIYSDADPTYLLLLPSTLADAVATINSSIFSPIGLQVVRSTSSNNGFYNNSNEIYPTLSQYLLAEYNRISVFTASNTLSVNGPHSYNFTTADNFTLFVNTSSILIQNNGNTTLWDDCAALRYPQHVGTSYESSVYDELALNQHFRFISDDAGNPFDNTSFKTYVRCGFSPIFNASADLYSNILLDVDPDEDGDDDDTAYPATNQTTLNATDIINYFSPLQYWSWAAGQPTIPLGSATCSNGSETCDSNESTATSPTPDDDDQQNQVAYSCGAVTPLGIKISNCYSSYPYACQKETDPNVWFIDYSHQLTYFASYLSSSCPSGYNFSLPSLSVEMLSLLAYVNSTMPSTYTASQKYVWVDLNDITVNLCFVSGGPYAACPYQLTTTYLGLVRMIAPNFFVAFVVLLLIFLERFIRTNPIQLNRKRYWRKALTKLEEEDDYDGVPS